MVGTYFVFASGSGGLAFGFGELLHMKAIDAIIMDVTANPPPASNNNVDCLCFSCRDVSVGGSSDSIVSSNRKLGESGLSNNLYTMKIYLYFFTMRSNKINQILAKHYNGRMTSPSGVHCIH